MVARSILLACTLLLSTGVERAQAGPPPPVEEALREAEAVWGVPYYRLACLAWRESSWNPLAYNRAGYHGLMQYDWTTWFQGIREARNPADPEYPLVARGSSPYQARESALVTGYFIAKGEGWRWPPLRWC